MGTGPNRGHRSTCPRFRPYRVHGRKSGLGRQLPRRRAVGMGAPASRDSAFYRCWRRGVRIEGGLEDSRRDHHRSHHPDSPPPLAAVQSAHRGKSCQAGGRRPVKGRFAQCRTASQRRRSHRPVEQAGRHPARRGTRRRVARPARPARTTGSLIRLRGIAHRECCLHMPTRSAGITPLIPAVSPSSQTPTSAPPTRCSLLASNPSSTAHRPP